MDYTDYRKQNETFKGRRIVCVEMNDKYNPVPSGTEGTVKHIDDTGTIFVKWDNGSTLGLVINEDKYRFVEEDTKKCSDPEFWGCSLFINDKCGGCPKFL